MAHTCDSRTLKLRGQKQEDHKFKVTLGYPTSSRSPLATSQVQGQPGISDPAPSKVSQRRKEKEAKGRGTGVGRGRRKGRGGEGSWLSLAESSQRQAWVESLDLSYQEYLQVAICSELGKTNAAAACSVVSQKPHLRKGERLTQRRRA